MQLASLSKGGTVVKAGDIVLQHVVPPETIKDSMGTWHGVPDYFLVGDQLFDPSTGVCTCELEFPAYFNFFALKKKTRVLCTPLMKKRIQEIFATAVFGPQRLDSNLEPGLEDILAEMRYFRASPFGSDAMLELDHFLEFIMPDASGNYQLGDLTITRSQNMFQLSYQAQQISWPVDPELPEYQPEEPELTEPFTPPCFGVTIIGSGHGFDKSSKTCGFLIWGNQAGILVDPPIDTTHWLKENGLGHLKIHSLILTHCHADHDSGTLQKILEQHRVDLFSTRAVHEAFVIKGCAMTGMTRENYCSLYNFHAVRVMEPTFIEGLEFRFRWSLHSVPTIGFEVFHSGRSFIYTSDHLFDWKTYNDLYQKSLISFDRHTELQDFPWHHPLIFHEAGAPPLHTPIANLEMLPEAVKRRIHLLHVSESQIKPDSCLKIARPGLANTVVLKKEQSELDKTVKILEILSRTPLFSGFQMKKAPEFLNLCRIVKFPQGEKIIQKGSTKKEFYLILGGQAKIHVTDNTVPFIKVYGEGDYFGETSIILDIPRTADVFAHTDLECATVDEYEFLYWIRGTDVAGTVRRLHANRLGSSWELMMESPLLKHLSSTQKTHLQSLMRKTDFDPGTVLFPSEICKGAALIESGTILLQSASKKFPSRQLMRGDLVTDPKMLAGLEDMDWIATVESHTTTWWLPKDTFVDFLNSHPGIALRLKMEMGYEIEGYESEEDLIHP